MEAPPKNYGEFKMPLEEYKYLMVDSDDFWGYDDSSYPSTSSGSSCSPYNYRYSNSSCNSYVSEPSEECKEYIMERDNYTCQCNCGHHTSYNLQIDHINPESLSGGHGADNLQVLCNRHKIRKSNKRKLSSTNWIKRQINDPYVIEANKLGYKSRAAFKLLQINEKYNSSKIFKHNSNRNN